MTMHTPDFRAVIRAGDDPTRDEVLVYARRLVNEKIRGHLDLHYDTRTIRITDVDGDAALRLMKAAAEYDVEDRTSGRWAEDCDPCVADAFKGWAQFSPDRMLGSRWSPKNFTPGDAQRRRVVYAAYRLVTADPDSSAPLDWSEEVWRDYLIVFDDFDDTVAETTTADADERVDATEDVADGAAHEPDLADESPDPADADGEAPGGDSDRALDADQSEGDE